MWLHEGYASYMRPLYGLWREGDARYLAILLSQRDEITNKVPVVSGKSRSGSDLEDPVSGPGQDVYVKASWMLHTLRHLIGDRDFWTVTRLAVYGRTDPTPGNFVPRYGSTREYEALVRQVTGKDYAWFFDVYLRQAQLPELIATRDGGRLKVSWRAPHGLPFPMPVELQVDGCLRYLKMVDGSETIVIPPTAHVVLDPEARVLKQSDAADNYRRWKEGLRK
jgi:aminopeptidase N